MSGGSVYDYLHKQKGVFKLPSLLKVAIDVSKGMNYLHQNNIIHRDLKAANLLMDENEVRLPYPCFFYHVNFVYQKERVLISLLYFLYTLLILFTFGKARYCYNVEHIGYFLGALFVREKFQQPRTRPPLPPNHSFLFFFSLYYISLNLA